MKHIKHMTVASAQSNLATIFEDFKGAIRDAFEALVADLRNLRS